MFGKHNVLTTTFEFLSYHMSMRGVGLSWSWAQEREARYQRRLHRHIAERVKSTMAVPKK